jgi:hypothetical protein
LLTVEIWLSATANAAARTTTMMERAMTDVAIPVLRGFMVCQVLWCLPVSLAGRSQFSVLCRGILA